jgi:hypothetical protein
MAPDVRAGNGDAAPGDPRQRLHVTQSETQAAARGESPGALLESWREFVDACEQGYEYNVMEYHADLSVRDRVEACLGDAAAPGGFAARVAEQDERFRALLQPGVQVGPESDAWWHRGVLQYAGGDLAAGLREWFDVEVAVRE